MKFKKKKNKRIYILISVLHTFMLTNCNVQCELFKPIISETKSIYFYKIITAVVLVLCLTALQRTLYASNTPLMLNNIVHFPIFNFSATAKEEESKKLTTTFRRRQNCIFTVLHIFTVTSISKDFVKLCCLKTPASFVLQCFLLST